MTNGNANKQLTKIRINRHTVLALIDSGSDSAIISPVILNQREIEQIRQGNIEIIGINGEVLSLLGVLDCVLHLCDQAVQMTIRVSKYVPRECVLGRDVL